MKKKVSALLTAAVLLTGCGSDTSSEAKPQIPDGITMHTAEDVGSEYADAIKAYFTALDQNDYKAYSALVHPVYAEAFSEYLAKKDSTLKDNFNAQRKRFDEDGYAGWRITDITLSKYAKPDYDYYFSRFTDAGILTDEQVQAVKDSAWETEDLEFSVGVLYEGDPEPVTVFSAQEMILFKTADGVRVFG